MSIRCPYNHNHIIPADSFTNHLNKCNAKNKHLFVQCKYNLRHVIRKEYIEAHYKCKEFLHYV